MRVVPLVDSDGVVLREATEHQARELLKAGRVVPVWGARRIIALLNCRRDEVVAIDNTSGGAVWSPTQYSDGTWTLNEIPQEYGSFFSPRWLSIFQDAQRPSVYLSQTAPQTTRRCS